MNASAHIVRRGVSSKTGGIPNKTKVGDMGIDGRIFPVSSMPAKQKTREGQTAVFGEFMHAWFPIQVKQTGKVGRPDIDAFEAVMMREERERGYFVAFGYSSDAEHECAAFHKRSDELHVQKM